jgi:hypothetical protein
MIIVLAIGPKVRGFKPGRERYILRAIKLLSTTFFGREVKPSVPCRKVLHTKLKILTFFAKFLLLCYQVSARYCQRALVSE